MPVRFTQTDLNPNAAAPAMSQRFDETKSQVPNRGSERIESELIGGGARLEDSGSFD